MSSIEQAQVESSEKMVDGAEEPQVEITVAEAAADARATHAEEACAEKATDSAKEAQVDAAVDEEQASVKEMRVEETQAEPEMSEDIADVSEMQVEPQSAEVQTEGKEGVNKDTQHQEVNAEAEPKTSEDIADVSEMQAEPHSETQMEDKEGVNRDTHHQEAHAQSETKSSEDIADVSEMQVEPQSEVKTDRKEGSNQDAQHQEAHAQAEPKTSEDFADVSDMQVEPRSEVKTDENEGINQDTQHQEAQEKLKAPSDEMPPAHKTPDAKNRKRAASSKTPGLEVMAAKVKRLREEADQAEAAIAEEEKKVEELQAKIASMRAEADLKRSAAQRAIQEYVKKQSEASIAHLDACIPKRPPNPFMIFRAEVSTQLNAMGGKSAIDLNKQIAERWANLSPEEKQKYKDRHAEGQKKFNEWGNSEEGRRNLRERHELVKKCKSTGMEELGKAIEAIDSGETDASIKVSPAKRPAEAGETPTKEVAVKQRKIAAAKVATPTKGLALDENILEEAGKADLVAQLRNLASRPDVLALGKSARHLLDALKAHKGMVNAAKHALLST